MGGRLNPEQLAAIEERGVVFVSAGAGTGKTTVLVERFVKAVCERGLAIDSVLVITYTERASGELKARIRERLVELGRHDLARDVDRAWISTIHGFCSRFLRNHPFEAGLDPRFRVLDESQARVLRSEAFASALARFCAPDSHDPRRPERLRLLATYGARGLATMLTGVFGRLRSAGRPLELAAGEVSHLADALMRLRETAEETLAHTAGYPEGRAQVERALELLSPPEGDPTTHQKTSPPPAQTDSHHPTKEHPHHPPPNGVTTGVTHRGHPPERLLDLSELRVVGPGSERFASYGQALEAVERAALDEVAARDRELLQELLEGFDRAYRQAKERESALDFEDLQLIARDLLRSDEAVRERARWRFRSIMVDEFQDTNRLQCELIDLLAEGSPHHPPEDIPTTHPRTGSPPGSPPELFFVGDEFQSIYRFRHADVEVFRERRASSSGVLALTHNYRSRPEVLAVVNHIFGAEFGGEFEPLQAAGRFPGPLFGPAVELLVTDKPTYREGGVHWRIAEARHVARRVRALVDAGECTPGEVVLLFAAGTEAERYEEALREEGLSTYRAAGRGYFGQQQVADLVAYLRLVHNRYDDEALVTVLASPFVGVSNDALVLLRRAAGRRPLFCGLEREPPPGLGPRDRRLFGAFRQRYERLARAAASAGLERLCDRIVSEHDYDLAVLARWDGRRRYANLRKLARLARSYEELRGPDIEGFVRFLRDQEAAGGKEVEAVAEEEGADAVRLLTIHAAKGLEFKVVVVADAGRNPASPSPDEILCLPDGRFGFRVVDPATGERRGVFGYDEVRRAERAAEEAESRRLYYVAMTRAIDRLIISGAVDPTSSRDARAPIGWVLERLGADLTDEGPVELERDGARVLLRVDRRGREPEPGPSPAPDEAQLELFAPGDEGAGPAAPELPPLLPIPEPPAHRIRRLSYTALALFERCSYRFYAERIVGLSPGDEAGAVPGGPGLAATEIGDAVHVLLELGVPAAEAGERVLARYPAAAAEDLERIATLVHAWHDCPIARRLAGLEGVRRERPFAFEHAGVLLHGRFDVFRLVEGRALVADYKTNRLDDLSPGELVDAEYGLQRLVYALAAFRAGAEEVEVDYVFLERPEEVVSKSFSRGETAELEAQLSQAIRAIQQGEFRPTPSELACAGCPALDVVCAGPRLLDAVPAAAPSLGA